MASRSLTKSALKLNISQPAVSTHLRRFEDCTGFSPLTRVGNEMVVASKEAQNLLEDMIALENKLLQMGRNDRIGKKALGVCQYWGMRLISDFELSKYFYNNFVMNVDCSKKLMDMYIEGDIDLIIRAISPSEDPILSEEFSLSWAGNFKVDKISGERPIRVILGNPAAPFGAAAREWLASNGVPYVVVMECDNPKLLPELCKNLNSISAVPTEFAKNGEFLFDDSFGGIFENIGMTVGLFFRERCVSLVEAEECFKNFTASVVGDRRALRVVS